MIIAAAVRIGGNIYDGSNHGDAIRNAVANGVTERIKSKHQGFITDDGQFLSRREAWEYAKHTGQIVTDNNVPRELFSEDLWSGEVT